MGLSRTQFDLMTNLEAAGSRTPTQRELAAASGRSVGTVNKTLKELQELGYVQKNQLTPQGLAALEPYRAKREVFVAAGFGSRMVPITLNTPKPLVRVNGTRMIDTLLDAVVVRLPVAWLLSQTGNLTLVWLAFPIAELMSLTLSAIFLRKTLRMAERAMTQSAS